MNESNARFASEPHLRINNLVLVAVALFILLTASLAWFVLSKIREETQRGIFRDLTLNLVQTEKILSLWQEQIVQELESVAAEKATMEHTKALLTAYKSGDLTASHPANLAMRQRFEVVAARTPHLGFFIIAPDSTNIASMRDENIGEPNLIAGKRPDLFKRLKSGESLLVPPITSDVPIEGEPAIASSDLPATMFIATPIRENGEIIAILTARLSPSGLFSRLISLGTISEKGLTYAYDDSGYIVSDVPGIRILDERVTFSFPEAEAVVQQLTYTGLSGQPVLGATSFYPEWGLGLATEISAEEAFYIYAQTRQLMVGGLLAMLLTSVILLFGVTRLSHRANNLLHENQRKLEGINERLLLRDQQREEMIYTLSHDLRSPLTNIARFSSRLSAEYRDKLDDHQLHYLERIDNNVERMRDLIESLFQVLQVELSLQPKSWVDTSAVVQRVAEQLQDAIDQAGVSLKIQPDMPPVYADADMLSDCLEKLITNAIKYRNKTGEAEIKLTARRVESGVKLSVQDNGIGIAPRHQQSIFRIFKRLEADEGHGVGLTMVKSVMEKHGGRVTLTSRPGRGSTFSLIFPDP